MKNDELCHLIGGRIDEIRKKYVFEKKNGEKFGEKEIMPNFAPVSERHLL